MALHSVVYMNWLLLFQSVKLTIILGLLLISHAHATLAIYVSHIFLLHLDNGIMFVSSVFFLILKNEDY